jgi:hypothetical protein
MSKDSVRYSVLTLNRIRLSTKTSRSRSPVCTRILRTQTSCRPRFPNTTSCRSTAYSSRSCRRLSGPSGSTRRPILCRTLQAGRRSRNPSERAGITYTQCASHTAYLTKFDEQEYDGLCGPRRRKCRTCWRPAKGSTTCTTTVQWARTYSEASSTERQHRTGGEAKFRYYCG